MNKIKMINRSKNLFLFLTILMAACQSTQKSQIQPATVPKNYVENNDTLISVKDTLNSASVKWRSLFKDSFLLNLMDTALSANRDIQIAFQRIQMAGADVSLAKSALRPSIYAGASGGVVKFGDYTMDGAGNKNTVIYQDQYIPRILPQYSVGIGTSWEIDIWGKLKNKKKAAIARFLSTSEGKNIVLTNLLTEIAISYYELLALDQSKKIVAETIGLQKNALDIVRVQKEAAVTNELAVLQFEVQVLHLEAFHQQLKQQINTTENKINKLIGRFPQQINRDTSLFTNQIPETVSTGIPSELLQYRPDIRQAEYDLIAAKADVMSAKAAFYPSLNISGNLGYEAYKASLLFVSPESIAFSLFGNLTAPIINRSAIKSAFNVANARQLEALYNYEKTIVNAYIEVYNEMQTIRNMEKILEFKNQEVDVSTHSIEIAGELFKTGRANYLEVLFNQQNTLQSKLEFVDAKKNQFIATVNIYKALGGGWQ